MQKLKRDVVYEGFVTLVNNTYRMADGKELVRDVVEHPAASVVLPLLEGDRVILVEQFRPGANRKLLELPAGCIEPGEDPRDCALRELEEETGWRAEQAELLFSMYPSPGVLTEYMHIFLATGLSETGTRGGDEDEDITVHTLTLAELRVQLRAGNIRDGKTIAALGYLLVCKPHLAR